MGKRLQPRHGSMGYWPRKRAKRPQARARSWPTVKEPGLLGFPCYKAGMTRVTGVDARKNSKTKGETITEVVTILECPPVKLYSIRCYQRDAYGEQVFAEVVVGKDKHLWRKLFTKKSVEKPFDGLDESKVSRVTVIVMTQPSKTGIGAKKPALLELQVGGKPAEALAWAKEEVGKELTIKDVFKEGEYADARGVTTGRGFQGAVKRFGIGLKASKSEKGRRTPGSLGGWSGQQHFMYRVAHAGQTGYHQRIQFNNQLVKFVTPAEVSVNGGLLHYGLPKNDCLLVKGSILGPKKRLVTLTKPLRLYRKEPPLTVESISLESQQRR